MAYTYGSLQHTSHRTILNRVSLDRTLAQTFSAEGFLRNSVYLQKQGKSVTKWIHLRPFVFWALICGRLFKAGTIGQIVTCVLSGLSLTRPQGTEKNTMSELTSACEQERAREKIHSNLWHCFDIFKNMVFYRLISSHTQLKETIIIRKILDFYGDVCFGLPSVCRLYLLFSFTVPPVYSMESKIRDRISSLNLFLLTCTTCFNLFKHSIFLPQNISVC